MISSRMRDWAEASFTILLMGCVPVIIRHTSANPWTIGLARLVIALTGLAILMQATRQWPRLSWREWRALALIGVLFGAHWAFYFLSIKASSAGIAVIAQATFGVHLVLIGWLIGHHAVTRVDLVAVSLAVAGSLLVAPRWSIQNSDTVGLLLGICGAFFYAFLPILHQRLAHIPSVMRVFGQFLFGLAVFVCFLPKAEWTLTRGDWFWLLVLGVVCTLVQHTLWTRITTRLSTLTTSVLFYMAVPVTLVLSVVLLHERVTPWMIGGATLIVFGNMLTIGVHRRREPLPVLARTQPDPT